jgi:diguanylate cyclase (GGDEF)-like protein
VRGTDDVVQSTPRFAERLVGAQPPQCVSRILFLLLFFVGVVSHVPGLTAAGLAGGLLLTVFAAVWTAGVRGYLWAAAGMAVQLSPPVTAVSVGGIALAALLGLGVVHLLRALTGLVSAAQAASLRQLGVRDELDRTSRAQEQELSGQIAYWASHDRLTQVLNRSVLNQHLEQLAAARMPTGILVISLARFAAVNEAFGFDVGDELLAGLAARLRTCARDTDVIARVGGDEFAVMLPGLSDDAARPVADRLLRVLADPFTVGPHVIPLHARAGLALDDGRFEQGSPELLRQAFLAAASATVGLVPAVFSAGDQEDARAAVVLEADLHQALERDELFLLYQPLVSTVTGRIESVEALVRWQHPERGLVPPDAFIGAAERSGQIVAIGLRVLEMATSQLRQWSDGPGSALTMAVNVSARQLSEPGFVQQVQSVLWGAGIDPHRVVLELTESLLVEDSDAAIEALWQLRGLGVRLALDDFGTGYSSLGRLGDLPLDELKIDKSFVDRLGVAGTDSTALVTAAIAMGHGLGLSVVAEGVESQVQAAQLAHLGCDLLQGYVLGRPQPADAIRPQLGQRLLPDPSTLPAPRTGEPDLVMAVPKLMTG